MKNDAVKLGLMYGVVSILISMIIYFTNPKAMMSFSSWHMILGYILMIAFPFMSAKRAKEAKGGFITFGEALVPAIVTFAIGVLINNIYTYLLLNHFDPSLQETINVAAKEMTEGMWDMMGLSEEAKLEAAEQMEQQQAGQFGLAQTALGVIISLVFPGLPIAAISAAILKKEEPMPVV